MHIKEEFIHNKIIKAAYLNALVDAAVRKSGLFRVLDLRTGHSIVFVIARRTSLLGALWHGPSLAFPFSSTCNKVGLSSVHEVHRYHHTVKYFKHCFPNNRLFTDTSNMSESINCMYNISKRTSVCERTGRGCGRSGGSLSLPLPFPLPVAAPVPVPVVVAVAVGGRAREGARERPRRERDHLHRLPVALAVLVRQSVHVLLVHLLRVLHRPLVRLQLQSE